LKFCLFYVPVKISVGTAQYDPAEGFECAGFEAHKD
jgi:hypothetical protein